MKLNKVLEIDFVDFISQKYREISENDRKIFWSIFLVLNFMFIFHTINYLWGHDDWWAINFQTNIDASFFNGRFGSYFLKTIFFQGQLLPVINNVFAFLGFTLGAISLLKYWELDNKVKYFVIAGLMFVCSPFTNAWLHFQHSIIESLWLILFIVVGLNFAIKYKITERLRYFVCNFVSIFLFLLCLSIYQPCLNAVMVILFGKLFIKSIEGKFKELVFIFRNSIVNVCISLFLYFVIYKICQTRNIIDSALYNQQFANNISIFTQLKSAFMAIFIELYNYEKILMPSIITKLFAIIVVLALCVCVKKVLTEKTDVLKKLFVSSFVLFLMLFTSQIVQIASEYNVFGAPRIVFFGTWIVHIFLLVLVFKYANIKVKNIVYLICLVLFFNYITVNFVSQKSFKFGTIAEVFRINRVTERIEQNKNFEPNKAYKLLVVGEFQPIRKNYVGKFNGSFAWEFADASIIPNYAPADALTFYNDELNVNELFIYNPYRFESEAKKSLAKLHENKIVIQKIKKHLKELESWPDENCIIIDDDLIIFVIDKVSLEQLKQDLSH